mgnify:FL=1
MSKLKKDNFEPYEIFTMQDYGHINVRLNEVLKSRGVSRNRLRNLVGSSYNVIARYCQADKNPMRSVDLDLLVRICCVLRCPLSDILEYIPEENNAQE